MSYQNQNQNAGKPRSRSESHMPITPGDEEGLDEQVKLEDFLGVDDEEEGSIPEVIDVDNVKVLVEDEDVVEIE